MIDENFLKKNKIGYLTVSMILSEEDEGKQRACLVYQKTDEKKFYHLYEDSFEEVLTKFYIEFSGGGL